MTFLMHPVLLADTYLVTQAALCEVRLLNDARYPWLVLVPRRADVTELTELDADDQAVLLTELNIAMRWVQVQPRVTKTNVGALGNLVPQLHVHVVGRHPQDPAWPGPVWGHSSAVAYASPALEAVLTSAAAAFGAAATG